MAVVSNSQVVCRSVDDLNTVTCVLTNPGQVSLQGSSSTLIFDLPLQTTVVPTLAIGSDTATFTRATVARMAGDFEGLPKEVLSGEVIFDGTRRVENIIGVTNSEDMTGGGYTAANGASITSATRATYNGDANGRVTTGNATIVDDGSGAATRTFVLRASITLISGTIGAAGNVKLVLTGNAITQTTISIGTAITSSPQVFSVSAQNDAAGTIINARVQCDDAAVLEITEWQLEESNGSNQNPSEYVSKGVESSPFHGSMVDAVQCFAYANGNTVASGIVTEAEGAAFDATDDYNTANGPFGYRAQGQRQNIALHDSTLEDVVWAATNVTKADVSAVGPDGKTTAATLTATAGNGTVIQDLGVIASAVKAYGLWIKRKTGSGDIDLTLNGGGAWTTVTVTAGWTRVQITDTLADPDIGIRIVVDTDAVYVWQNQCEAAAFLSTGIDTGAAAVTRNIDVLTLPSALNQLDAAGTAFAIISTDWDDAPGNNSNILSTGTAGRTLFASTGSSVNIRSHDGTATSTSPNGSSYQNNPTGIASTWGTALTAYFDGSPDLTPAAYDGVIVAGANLGVGIDPGGSSATALYGNINTIQIFSDQKSDAEVGALPE